MYKNAYKCNFCGFLSKDPGTHCGASLVPVVVLDNIFPEPSAVNTIVVREVVHEIIREVPEKKPVIEEKLP